MSFLADAGTSTSYTDTSAANGTTYYYKVSAENGNGEGPLSNEANATPIDLVPPVAAAARPRRLQPRQREPAVGRREWSNAIIGWRERPHVTSNQLACSATTTCTAWRNDAQYGPDAEVWAR